MPFSSRILKQLSAAGFTAHDISLLENYSSRFGRLSKLTHLVNRGLSASDIICMYTIRNKYSISNGDNPIKATFERVISLANSPFFVKYDYFHCSEALHTYMTENIDISMEESFLTTINYILPDSTSSFDISQIEGFIDEYCVSEIDHKKTDYFLDYFSDRGWLEKIDSELYRTTPDSDVFYVESLNYYSHSFGNLPLFLHPLLNKYLYEYNKNDYDLN